MDNEVKINLFAGKSGLGMKNLPYRSAPIIKIAEKQSGVAGRIVETAETWQRQYQKKRER